MRRVRVEKFFHRLFMVADSLYDYLPLSVLSVFRKIKLIFCTQQEVDCEDRYILQMASAKLKIYGYYILTFLNGGTMISNIVYFNTTSNSGKQVSKCRNINQ